MLPVFFKIGLRMGAIEYLDNVLKVSVLPWIVTTFPDPQEVLFVQGCASCYTAKTVETWLSETMSCWPKHNWPGSSLDLKPLNFSVWAYIEAWSCDCQHPNIGVLKSSITKQWAEMPEPHAKGVCSKFRPRIKAVTSADGGYID